ncbi:Hypothetical predicted protein [Mytilus galloprovincialis]|uniref:alpha-L-fucosidase n=1 Tax=Mytilus galloprovincialis TaxID=29158 RepID=A0A8B6CLW2_MYTGA|nr:Hypothetical predicted protein [Mytilus galloprovincialis]
MESEVVVGVVDCIVHVILRYMFPIFYLFSYSPTKDTVVTNDRFGHDCKCKHGSYKTCRDRFNPGVLQKFKWENSMTIDKHSWGYRRNSNIEDYLSVHDIISVFASTIRQVE